MTVPSMGWAPLPECSSCGRPTRRAGWSRRGGRCAECAAATLPVVLAESRLQLQEWQQTVQRVRRAEAEQEAARADRRRARRQQR